MAEESRDDWTAAMSEAFSFSIASIEAERELRNSRSAPKQVEAELRRMQKSKWWRMTSP